MKTRILLTALLAAFVSSNLFAAPPRIFRVEENIAPKDAHGYTKVQVFYETDFTSYVCINVLSNDASRCGTTNVKKCYNMQPSVASAISGITEATEKIRISIEEGSLKSYGGVSEESKSGHNYLYVFSVIDTTNHKRCNVNVSGKNDTRAAFNPDTNDVKACIYDAANSCITISMDCIDG